jgi:hypothetical protein
MKPMPRATIVIVIAASSALVSCATVGKTTAAVRNSTSATAAKITALAKMPKLPKFSDTALARLMPGSGVKVVEVREKELKELPTGQERVLAYRNERKNGFWIFGGPVDFKEPTLPEPGANMDGSLLPPRMP